VSTLVCNLWKGKEEALRAESKAVRTELGTVSLAIVPYSTGRTSRGVGVALGPLSDTPHVGRNPSVLGRRPRGLGDRASPGGGPVTRSKAQNLGVVLRLRDSLYSRSRSGESLLRLPHPVSSQRLRPLTAACVVPPSPQSSHLLVLF